MPSQTWKFRPIPSVAYLLSDDPFAKTAPQVLRLPPRALAFLRLERNLPGTKIAGWQLEGRDPMALRATEEGPPGPSGRSLLRVAEAGRGSAGHRAVSRLSLAAEAIPRDALAVAPRR